MTIQRSNGTKAARRRRVKWPMLCVDWGDQTFDVALVGIRRSRPTILGRWLLERPREHGEMDPTEVGAWLRNQWNEHQIPRRPVFVSAPRRQVLLKTFRQRAVPGTSLIDAILLQAESRFPMPLEDLIVDFGVQSDSDAVHHLVLAGRVSKDAVGDIRETLEAASLELRGIGLGELGLNAVLPPGGSQGLEVVVYAGDENLELVAFRCGAAFLTQSLLVPSGPEERRVALDKLIDRFEERINSFDLAVPNLVCLCGPLASVVKPLVASRFHEVIESQTSRDHCPRLSGLAESYRTSHENLDFLVPRRPPDRHAHRRRVLLTTAAFAAAVAFAFSVWLRGKHENLDRQIAALQQEQQDLDERVKGSESSVVAAQTLREWNDSRVPWSESTNDLLQHLGGNDRCFLERLQLESLPDAEEVSARLTGLARSDRDALTVADRLVKAADGYSVNPGPIKPSRRDPYYRSTFDFRIGWREGRDSEDPDVEK